MPGTRITSKQVEIYMRSRKQGSTQELAAAKAGISKSTGSLIDRNKRQGKRNGIRTWQTRKGPFDGIWEAGVVPKLQQGIYQATFLLRELQKQYPDQFADSTLRSLQRKIAEWRALHGPDKEVMFLQVHEPGALGVSDFTHPKDIQITIKGVLFEHIFYHFRLPYSGFNYMQVFAGSGEPFTAFAQGLQEALHAAGGVPTAHRTDSLSAAFKNLSATALDDATERYHAFAEHYGMEAKRINPGKGHENGTIESSHRHIKERVDQCLIMRGSIDFDSLESYRLFIQDVTLQHNRHNVKNLEIERTALKALPETKATDYTEAVAIVSSTSTIDVARVTYSVPSRLIGTRLHVKIYHDKLECYLGSIQAVVLKRQCKPVRGKRARVIDYKHVIGSLVKKPGAFRSCRFRDDLLPNDDYRFIWEYANRTMPLRDSGKFIVGLLNLAATQDCENNLAIAVMQIIRSEKPLKLADLQNQFNHQKIVLPDISVPQHSLSAYNRFIPSFQGSSL